MGVPTAVHGTRLSAALRSLHLWIAVGVVGSVGLALTGTNLGAIPRPGVHRWWFHVPEGGRVLATVGFYASVGVLLAGWIGVGVQARAGRLSVTRSWVILGLWGLPLFLGPPLFSRDIYSYIGQGLLAHHGLNPYSVAPSALGPGPLLASIAEVWRNTASPYGPLFVTVSRATVTLAGHSLVAQVLAFRLLEMVGVAMIMVAVPRLCRRSGGDPGVALWLAALSPLALFSFVASGHNDALMVGLLLTGILLAVEGRLAVGLGLCALAATIKLPAAAAIVLIGVDQFRSARGADRWRVVVDAVVVPVAVVAAITLAAGLGWTWLGPTALHVPTELRVLSSPSVSLGAFAYSILHALGFPVAVSATVTVTQAICEVITVAGLIWLVVHVHRLDVVRVIGLSLMLVVVGSPTLWPWYLLWGLAVLAVTELQRSLVLAAVAGVAMLVVGSGGAPLLRGHAYDVTAPLLLAGVAWLAWHHHWRQVVTGHAA